MPVDVLVPPLGTTVDTLTLISWYKQEGETVVKDEPLFMVETDKATLDVEAPASGILCGVCAGPGDEIPALTRIATIRTPGEQDRVSGAGQIPVRVVAPGGKAPAEQNVKRVASYKSHQSYMSHTSHPTELPSESDPRPPTPYTRIFISPRAKLLAEERGLEWRAMIGTGPEGAIVERDIVAQLAAARPKTASPVAQRMAETAGVDWRRLPGSGLGGRVIREDVQRAAAPASAADFVAPDAGRPAEQSGTDQPPDRRDDADLLETIPMAGARAVIAARMMQSAGSTAPVTLTAQADATALVQLRAELAADGLAISYNALLLKILGRALREHPRLNASIDDDVIKVWRSVHIGLAVDSEAGLRVPVVRNVDLRGLANLESDIRALAEAARDGRTPPDAMRGGTFTLTNLGMYGIAAFTPVINLPECAILGVGQIRPEPAIVDGTIVARQRTWLSLTFDHRLVDGGPAARFLQRVVQLIERPHLLLS